MPKSDCILSAFPCSDSDDFLHRGDEDFPVSDLSCFGSPLKGLDDLWNDIIRSDQFNLDLGEEIDLIFGSAVDFGMPSLPSKSFDFGNDEQRGRIFDSVMRISDAPVADGPAPDVADSLPGEVPMQDLPAGVTRDIPLVQGHKFVKFDDRILIVNSASRLIVAMLPRYKLLQ